MSTVPVKHKPLTLKVEIEVECTMAAGATYAQAETRANTIKDAVATAVKDAGTVTMHISVAGRRKL
jgi:hypothetical protein